MAISSTQYIDLLVKKLAGVAKTDTATNKGPSNESIASPPLIRGDIVWVDSANIPATAQVVSGVTQAYLTISAIECEADTTSVPIGGVYPTWKTNLTDWISTEFGSTWSVKVFVDDASATNPTSSGTEIFAAGSGGSGQYYFDHQSGILNFIGETIPTVLTSSKKIYVTGYRYVGTKGISAAIGGSFGNLTISDTTIGTQTSNANIVLATTGSGIVEIAGTNGILLPTGTTAERPNGSSYVGTLRFNTDLNLVEFYNGAIWQPLNPEVSIDSQVFDGDGSTATFTLLRAVSAIGLLVSINGTMQQPTTAYVVSGDEITFDEPPKVGDVVELRYITLGYDNAVDTIQTVNAVAFYNTPNTVSSSSNYTFNPSTSRLSLVGDLSIGNIVLKDDGDNKIGFYQADGVTPAIINATTEIVADSIASGTSELTFSGVNGNIVANVGGSTIGVLSSTGLVITGSIEATNGFVGLDATAITNGTSEVAVISSGGNIRANVGGTTVATISSSGISSNFTGDLTGNVTGDLTGNTSGNAGTATKWATARTLSLTGAITGSASIDGSGDISLTTTATNDPTLTLIGDVTGSATFTNLGNATLTATIAANSVALGTDTTGSYVASGATSGNGISGSVNAEGGIFTVTSNATTGNTPSTIVFRDASGNFSAGTITATTTQALYADLAEKYIADSEYEPGTIVEFGGAEEVTETTVDHSVKVAGVISTAPAYLMNSSSTGVAVALMGKVPCKVTGKVHKGDRIVSSEIPGVGMALDPSKYQPGCIIGKALTSSEGGLATIEVVVGRI